MKFPIRLTGKKKKKEKDKKKKRKKKPLRWRGAELWRRTEMRIVGALAPSSDAGVTPRVSPSCYVILLSLRVESETHK